MKLSRVCNCCSIDKPLTDFAKCSADKTYGVKGNCKACCAVWRAEHYAKNRDRELSLHVAYREANLDSLREKRREYQLGWVERNYDLKRAMDKEYEAKKRAEKDPVFLQNSLLRARNYQASKLSATPPWADKCQINQIYKAAKWLTRVTGKPFEVDHIIPLQGKGVTGLHVHTNLRVVPMFVNRSKGNKLIGSLV